MVPLFAFRMRGEAKWDNDCSCREEPVNGYTCPASEIVSAEYATKTTVSKSTSVNAMSSVIWQEQALEGTWRTAVKGMGTPALVTAFASQGVRPLMMRMQGTPSAVAARADSRNMIGLAC